MPQVRPYFLLLVDSPGEAVANGWYQGETKKFIAAVDLPALVRQCNRFCPRVTPWLLLLPDPPPHSSPGEAVARCKVSP